MSIVIDSAHLKRRVERYLWHDESMPLVYLRQLLKGSFGNFERVAIIGGLVRDFARRGSSGFRSDVDLVIDAPEEAVAALAHKLQASANRFGGYGYRHPNWKIDFWALETTWAARRGLVVVNELRDLVNCTFFDWDAVLYDLHARRIIANDDYLDKLRRRRIEINLLPTPSVQGNLLRAVRRLLLWNLEAGPKLKDFIDCHLDADSFAAISQIESSIYYNPILKSFRDEGALAEQLFSLGKRTLINTDFGEQLRIPGVEHSKWRLAKGAL